MMECQLKCHFSHADMMAKVINLETLEMKGILCKNIIFAIPKNSLTMNKTFTYKYLLLLIFFFTITKTQSQIIGWQFGSPASLGSETTYPSTTNNANLNSAVLSRGSGITGTALGRAFSANVWTNSGTKTDAITNNQYYTFAVKANTGYKFSLSTLDARLRRSGATAPNSYIWRYSTDGSTFNDIETDIGFTSTADGATQTQLDLSLITALQNVPSATTVTFRLYAWGATAASTPTFAIGRYGTAVTTNSLAIGGTVVSTISSDATLSNLVSTSGALTPSFSASTINYTSSVANVVTSTNVTPTATDANSNIKVNGVTVANGSTSSAINLNVGSNTITTVVTAQNGTTTKTYSITITRAAAGTPLINTTSSLTAFGNVCINTTAVANSFTLDGSDLDGTAMAISALPGFAFSETAGGTYTNTLSFTYTGTSFTGKIIYVQFSPTVVQSYDGNIVLNGGGVSNYNVAASGTGINTAPTVTTTGSTNVTATSATISGVINATGCSSVSSYGFEYSTTTGFPNGTGTQVVSSNLNAGNFSAALSGLAPNTRYYFKAFATNSIGTTYGIQFAFTCMTLPVVMSAQPGFTYTETFADITNWSNFFISGIGANHFSGLISTGSGGIPNGTTLTTSTFSFQPLFSGGPSSSGGVHKGTDQVPSIQSIVLLSTSSTENSTSAAIDFYMDFTGVNANTLSFDYAVVNNPTGSRNGSLRVYATVDGIIFTEIPFTSVLNFINNTTVSGSKTNITLPTIFNNSATARLRFYYYNGDAAVGTGNRPKISIDNLNVTAVANTPCATPTAPAKALSFGTITDVSIQGSYAAANPATDSYLIVMSTNSSLISNPVNGQTYSIGDNVGDGSVISKSTTTSFMATGLTAQTTYYFFVFPMNAICTGGPLYYTATVLTGSATTIAGLPPCAAPTNQPTNLTFATSTTSSITGSFTATTADQYLVVRSSSSSLGADPANATSYNAGDALGNGTVVQRSAATTFTANSLMPNTPYFFFVFSLNSQACINGPAYNVTNPLTASQSTIPLPPCTTPTAQGTALSLAPSNTSISGTFTGLSGADNYLIIKSTSATLGATPTDNTDYNAGDVFGNGTVLSNTTSTTFYATALMPNTTYYFFIFAANKLCSGGTKYATQPPLSGNISTTIGGANNYYFGTLHSHSDFSDGNADNPGFTPAQDYAYAKNSLCMDYLGISEHNHFSTQNQPGNQVNNYHQGSIQANDFSTANSTFLAMYGMEWGVISGGGHVVIYGDGMDDLYGWESGSGTWGTANNYDVFVPKSVYTGSTGLFKTVNDYSAKNTFATLAHPNLTDFNNIAGIAYDAAADSAIVGAAVESGPAFSTNTTYSNPGSSLSYLYYYQLLLSKGYHLGPTIDHDNHNTTFGRTTTSRTAIVAPSLTKTAIVSAMRNMNFYATQDCDTKVDFTINTKIIGSTLSDRFGPNIYVSLTDATTAVSSAVIRVMYGAPGSGVNALKIDSAIGSTLTFTDNNLANMATGYYYLDITNGASRIVTSPIWYTRNDALTALPVKLNSFTVQKANNNARLDWSTDQELNSSYFSVERSADGRKWNSIMRVNAAGNTSTVKNYRAFDNAPLNGINYYRLKQFDVDGKFEYSIVKNVSFNKVNNITIAPNPAKDFINISTTKNLNTVLNIQLVDVSGKVLKTVLSSDNRIKIATSGIAKGLYFIKIKDENTVQTQRVIIE